MRITAGFTGVGAFRFGFPVLPFSPGRAALVDLLLLVPRVFLTVAPRFPGLRVARFAVLRLSLFVLALGFAVITGGLLALPGALITAQASRPGGVLSWAIVAVAVSGPRFPVLVPGLTVITGGLLILPGALITVQAGRFGGVVPRVMAAVGVLGPGGRVVIVWRVLACSGLAAFGPLHGASLLPGLRAGTVRAG